MQKQSLNNILQKSPTSQQTIIEKHPVNPLILDIFRHDPKNILKGFHFFPYSVEQSKPYIYGRTLFHP